MTMTLLLIKMLDCVPGWQTGMSGEVDGNKQKFGRRKDKACLPLLLPKARGCRSGKTWACNKHSLVDINVKKLQQSKSSHNKLAPEKCASNSIPRKIKEPLCLKGDLGKKKVIDSIFFIRPKVREVLTDNFHRKALKLSSSQCSAFGMTWYF